jgi:hypothetical protein
MSDFMEYKSNNGYTGRMYGKSSLSIFDTNGKEIFHTGFRTCNNLKDFHKQVDDFPKFLDVISRMKEVE